MSDGWIEWGGGDCPVSEAALVEVMFCDGDVAQDPARRLVWKWQHGGTDGDIVAYRLVSASALTSQPGGTHYKQCSIQPVQYIEANKLQFLEGCIIKRATRHDKDTGKGREDIEKIIHEAKLILELRYGS